jgi:hypothetical protein
MKEKTMLTNPFSAELFKQIKPALVKFFRYVNNHRRKPELLKI